MIENSNVIRYFTGFDRQVKVFLETPELYDIHTTGSETWVCGANAFVAYSTTNGWSWNNIDLNAKCGWVGNVTTIYKEWGYFPNTIRVWGANNQAAYSSDQGVTWTREDTTYPAGSFTQDVADSGGYMIMAGKGVISGAIVGANFGSGATIALDAKVCVRNPSDQTHVYVGNTANFWIDILGWPPPTGHDVNIFRAKGSSTNTVGAVFDSANNLYLLQSDVSIIKYNKPGYTVVNGGGSPTVYSISTTSIGLTDTIKWMEIDATNYANLAICGQDGPSGEGCIWVSNTVNATISTGWTKYKLNYGGQGAQYFNKVKRGYNYGTWNAVGKSKSGYGCFARFNV